MKRTLLAMCLLSSVLTLSAQTFTCPANVMCTMNSNNLTTCSYGIGSNWVVSQQTVNLPKPNTLFYFNFQSAAGDTNGMFNAQHCSYLNLQHPEYGIVSLSAASTLIPQLNSPGSLWHATSVSGFYSCINAKYPDQCPFTNNTKK